MIYRWLITRWIRQEAENGHQEWESWTSSFVSEWTRGSKTPLAGLVPISIRSVAEWTLSSNNSMAEWIPGGNKDTEFLRRKQILLQFRVIVKRETSIKDMEEYDLWTIWKMSPEKLWSALDCFGLFWTVLDYFGLIWTALDCFGLLWTFFFTDLEHLIPFDLMNSINSVSLLIGSYFRPTFHDVL